MCCTLDVDNLMTELAFSFKTAARDYQSRCKSRCFPGSLSLESGDGMDGVQKGTVHPNVTVSYHEPRALFRNFCGLGPIPTRHKRATS